MMLEKMLDMQKKLDYFIVLKIEKAVTTDQLLTDTQIAMMVEIEEYQEACLNFLLVRSQENYQKMMEELADILHFWLSIYNQMELEIDLQKLELDLINSELEPIFICTEYTESSKKKAFDLIRISESFKHWKKSKKDDKELISYLMKQIFRLLFAKSANSKKLFECYLEKNKVNYERQENGY